MRSYKLIWTGLIQRCAPIILTALQFWAPQSREDLLAHALNSMSVFKLFQALSHTGDLVIFLLVASNRSGVRGIITVMFKLHIRGLKQAMDYK